MTELGFILLSVFKSEESGFVNSQYCLCEPSFNALSIWRIFKKFSMDIMLSEVTQTPYFFFFPLYRDTNMADGWTSEVVATIPTLNGSEIVYDNRY
jgi:hypothetical protein